VRSALQEILSLRQCRDIPFSFVLPMSWVFNCAPVGQNFMVLLLKTVFWRLATPLFLVPDRMAVRPGGELVFSFRFISLSSYHSRFSGETDSSQSLRPLPSRHFKCVIT